jgi:hypothetical protein
MTERPVPEARLQEIAHRVAVVERRLNRAVDRLVDIRVLPAFLRPLAATLMTILVVGAREATRRYEALQARRDGRLPLATCALGWVVRCWQPARACDRSAP